MTVFGREGGREGRREGGSLRCFPLGPLLSKENKTQITCMPLDKNKGNRDGRGYIYIYIDFAGAIARGLIGL